MRAVDASANVPTASPAAGTRRPGDPRRRHRHPRLRPARPPRVDAGTDPPGRVRPGRDGVPRRRGRPGRHASRGCSRGSSTSTTAAASAEHGLAGWRARVPGRGGARVLRGGRDPPRPADAATAQPVEHDADLAARARAAQRRRRSRSSTCSRRAASCSRRASCDCSRTGSPRSARRAATTRGSSSRPLPTAKTARTTTTSSSRRAGCARSTRSRSSHGGEIDLIFPTEMSLRTLARYECTRRPVHRPRRGRRATRRRALRVVTDGTGERVALPADAGRPTRSAGRSRCPTSRSAPSARVARRSRRVVDARHDPRSSERALAA